jgi:hypothetical protein
VADPTTAPSQPINPLQTALSALGFGASIYSGSPIGAAGSGAALASNLGAPSSVTQPVSIGASAAGIGANALSGNYLGAGLGLLGLSGNSLGIPSYVTQGAGLIGSIFTGNPIGMAVNGALVGKGLYNMATGLNYNGSWSPSASQLSDANAIGDDAFNQALSGIDSTVANNQALISAGQTPIDTSGTLAGLAQPWNNSLYTPGTPSQPQQTPQSGGTFTSAQLANIGQQSAYSAATDLSNALPGTYGSAPVDMMNQGEAQTPVAPYTPAAAMQLAYQNASQYTGGAAAPPSVYSPTAASAPVASAPGNAPRQYMSSLGLYGT